MASGVLERRERVGRRVVEALGRAYIRWTPELSDNRDVAVEASDDLGCGLLIGVADGAQVLGSSRSGRAVAGPWAQVVREIMERLARLQ